MERRELLKIAAVAATAGRLAEAQGHKFFTPEEFAVVDELMEIIIPADDHSPGARAAECAAFWDGRLAEEPDANVRLAWRSSIRAVDELSKSLQGSSFMKASPAGRIAVVERLTTQEETFMRFKEAAIRAYYTSKIGIHQEMEYKGNVVLNEFAGTEL
jgi:hypothetical protein